MRKVKEKKGKDGMDIGHELDAYLKENVLYESMTDDRLKKVKSGISKIVKRYFPAKTHQTFVVPYCADGGFYAIIGFREFAAKRFSFINCAIEPPKPKTEG